MKISTSILSSDDRIKSIRLLNNTSISYLHIDVMDGKFVSDIQMNTEKEFYSFNEVTKYPMDIHLMVTDPMNYINKLANMNIEFITFHVEIGKDIDTIVKKIHSMGYKASLAVNPNTDVSKLIPYLDIIDMVLLMSVEPGKGGQGFMDSTVFKISQLKSLIGNRNILIEVDGGINDKTIPKVKDVDIVVSGSYVVCSDDYEQRIEALLNGVK